MSSARKQVTIYPSAAARIIVGNSSPGCNSAIECWVRAIREIEPRMKISRAEWNFLADVLNGSLADHTWNVVAFCQDIRDANQIGGLAKKWIVNNGDAALADLLDRISINNPIYMQYILLAVRHYWANCDAIDLKKDEWWTVNWWLSAAAEG